MAPPQVADAGGDTSQRDKFSDLVKSSADDLWKAMEDADDLGEPYRDEEPEFSYELDAE